MATPRVIGHGNHFLESQCLAFTQALVNQKIGFNIQITSGSFSFSFDNKGKASARTSPSEVKKKSPSTRRRNARRRQQFLENKKLCPSDCDKLTLKQTQPVSEEITLTDSEEQCFPSSVDSSDDYSGCHIAKKMRMESPKVTPLKIPKHRIQQLDGNLTLSDISLCENDQRISEHEDQTDQPILCDMCNCKMTITHQCDNQILPDNKDQLSDDDNSNTYAISEIRPKSNTYVGLPCTCRTSLWCHIYNANVCKVWSCADYGVRSS